MGAVRKAPREPSIPNSYPFKQTLITDMEEKQTQEAQQLREKKTLRHKLKKQLAKEALDKKEDMEEDDHEYVDEIKGKIVRFEDQPQKENEGDANETEIKPVLSRKEWQRELKNIIEQSDVILEILDSRDPLGSRHYSTEQLIASKDKMLVLVLNKYDLIPKENAKQWTKGLLKLYPTTIHKISEQSQISNSTEGQENENNLKATKLNSTEKLLNKIKKYWEIYRNKSQKKDKIVVGVIGFPNAGKHTLISNLRKIICSAENKPQINKKNHQISIDSKINLIYTPGIVVSGKPTTSLILRNVLNISDIQDAIPYVDRIVTRINKKTLIKLYRTVNYETTIEFLKAVAEKSGKLNKGGRPDWKAAAKVVLYDWNNAKIPYFTQFNELSLSEFRKESDEKDE